MMLRLDLTWLRLCVAIRFAGATARDYRPVIGGALALALKEAVSRANGS
jgi:hypothetical protein